MPKIPSLLLFCKRLTYLVIDGGGTLYVRTRTGVTALDSTNGTTKWQITFGAAPGYPMVLGADGTMYVGSADGYLYAFWDAAERIGLAKKAPDGATVAPTDVIVTAVFGDYFYAESADRVSGIRAYKAGHGRSIGNKLSISGTIKTDTNGERYVDVQAIVPNGTGEVAPLGMRNKWVGGGNWFYDQPSGAGQQGVKDGCGLNTIGLLIRTSGVARIDANGLTVDDGSAGGVRVVAPGSVNLPANSSYVIVTGISSCEKSGSDIIPVIRIRTQSDIRVL